jgi:ADP-ribosyl-[dinitrogen reductase] hydrolase
MHFFYLKSDISYRKAIEDMLAQGGDTDTNAAIVGGLIGAKYGIDAIPYEWIRKVRIIFIFEIG